MWRSTTFLNIVNLLAKKLALPYHAGTQYAPYQTCLWRGTLQYCTTSTTGTYNPAHWANLLPYNPAQNYTPGNAIISPSPLNSPPLEGLEEVNSPPLEGLGVVGAVLQCTTPTTGYFSPPLGGQGGYNPAHWQAIQLHHAPVQWVDIWNSQTEYMGLNQENTELPFPMPAIFIAFHNTTWQNLGGSTGVQTGACTIGIHIVQEVYADSYHNSASQAAALSNLDFLDAVHTALQGNGGAYFTPLNRTEETLDTNHPNFSHHIISYTATIQDPAKAEENALLTLLHTAEQLHINPKYKDGVGGSYTMLAKIEQTIQQNQPPPQA